MRQKFEEHRPLVLILLAFILLGVVYDTATPIFEASDEPSHYPFVRHIAQGNGLPIQDQEHVAAWRQEGSQPPLFHILGAVFIFWIGTSDYEEVRWENPHARIGIPGSYGNKNMFVHTERENFPYEGTVLAVHLLRIISLLFGAASVAITYFLTLEIFPARKYLALAATIFHAFNPMFIFISVSVSNDALVMFFSSLALWLMVRLLKFGASDLRFLVLGVILGLASLTKLSGLALLLVAAILIAYLAYRRKSLPFFLRASLLVLLPTFLIAGWWYIRNLMLYGDPTGLNVMLAIAGVRPIPLSIGELEGFWISYWSIFGAFNILSLPIAYIFFLVATIGGVLGLVKAIYFGRGQQAILPAKYLGLLGLAVVLLSLALVRWTSLTLASSGRLLYPGISAISLFLALGWASLLPKKFEREMTLGWGVALATIALLTPILVIAPAYARPRLLSHEELVSIPNRLDATYSEQFRLMGYKLERQSVSVGDSVWVTLYWQALAPMAKDYSIGVKILGPEDEVYGQEDTYPGLGTFPTTLWRVGDAIAETHAIPIIQEVPYASAGRIEVVIYQFPTLQKLEAEDVQGRSIGRVLAGAVRLAPQTPPAYQIAAPLEFTLGEKITLIGYNLDSGRLTSGGSIELRLYWKALAPMTQDYQVFLHLVDAQGKIVAQADAPPLNGYYPTSLWLPGEIIEDAHTIPMPADLPAGEYRLRLGLYLLDTLERLPVVDREGDRVRNDEIIITGINLE